VQGVYAPYLTAELDRLFVTEVRYTTVLRACACGVRGIFLTFFRACYSVILNFRPIA